MTDEPIDPTDLETAIRTVYRGALEEFVSRRDALVKQLRAAGKRDDAARVKALRKPSRTAWALDHVTFEDAAAIDQLSAAITAAQVMQSGDAAAARAALENVRVAVRAVAHAGARASIRADHPIESTSLIAAVHAVMGDAGAFDDLRAGRLADIPEGGGLDILSAVAIAPPTTPAIAESRLLPATDSARDAELAAARKDLQRAEVSLAEARERAQAAERAVVNAQAKLDAAEQQLQRAQQEANARRSEFDRARADAKSASAQVHEAERAVADLRARIR